VWSACRRSASAGPETEETAKTCTALRLREGSGYRVRAVTSNQGKLVDGGRP
jgi:hypothetical protein